MTRHLLSGFFAGDVSIDAGDDGVRGRRGGAPIGLPTVDWRSNGLGDGFGSSLCEQVVEDPHVGRKGNRGSAGGGTRAPWGAS
jgi:hypothetical protein